MPYKGRVLPQSQYFFKAAPRYSICTQCGKKGKYTVRGITKCRYCNFIERQAVC